MTWVVGEDPPDCHNVERYRIIKRSVYSAPCFRYDLHGIIAFLLSFFNLIQPKRERTTIMEEKRIVKPWQAGLMLLVGIAVIIVGLLVMKLNNRIVLALDGVIMCLMAWCFGIPYAELQQGIKETVSSMIVAILILLAVGVRARRHVDGERHGAGHDLLRHEGADAGLIPAGRLHPLHADVDHGGHVVGHARDGWRRLHGRCTGSRCAAARGRGRGLHRRVLRRQGLAAV